ncbi:hypothetical protein FPSM_01773 [Flavobacterium psychrophilum]|nr:hypothetical protein FPSM_01773 [Flavobacterium psychrophilum]
MESRKFRGKSNECPTAVAVAQLVVSNLITKLSLLVVFN